MNQLAAAIVADATDEDTPDDASNAAPQELQTPPAKNPAAVALGKLEGAKGGAARAKALSKKRWSEIAKKAAKARWG